MHTLHRIERGTHKPSIGTAYKLARWLHRERRRDWGPWTLDRVIQSADMPAHMHRPLALERARQYAPDGAELGRTWFRGAANGWGWAFEFGEIVVFVDVGGCATMPMPDRIDWLGEVMAEPKANSDF